MCNLLFSVSSRSNRMPKKVVKNDDFKIICRETGTANIIFQNHTEEITLLRKLVAIMVNTSNREQGTKQGAKTMVSDLMKKVQHSVKNPDPANLQKPKPRSLT